MTLDNSQHQHSHLPDHRGNDHDLVQLGCILFLYHLLSGLQLQRQNQKAEPIKHLEVFIFFSIVLFILLLFILELLVRVNQILY